jgi:DNA-binding GntR family transcriptional regulator
MNKNTYSEMNKSESAYEYISQSILNRDLQPGERLVEREIARQLELSKTPVREALLRLREDGLVDGNFNSGVYVSRITPEDAIGILDIREALEGMAARRAAETAQSEDLADLRSIMAKMEHFLTNNMSQEYARQDVELHLKIVNISGNIRLQDILRKIRMQSKLLMASTMKLPGRGIKQTFTEHQAVCEAIVGRDPEAAEKSAREHIHRIREAVKKWMEVMY